MTKVVVTNQAGADVNGEHYPFGHEFEFDVLPDHIQAAVTSGDLTVSATPAEESPKGEDAGSDSSSESKADEASEDTTEDAPEEQSETTDQTDAGSTEQAAG